MKIRVPLTDKNSIIVKFTPSPISTGITASSDTVTDNIAAKSDSERVAVPEDVFRDYVAPDAIFTLSPSIPEAYKFSRYSYPSVPLSLSVPDADLSLANSWVNSTIPDSAIASDMLIKRMTEKVFGAYSAYCDHCSTEGLLNRPFRIGMALRLKDDSLIRLGLPKVVHSELQAPLMRLREPALSGNIFSCITEILNTPAILRVSLPAMRLTAQQLEVAEAVVFYATRQTYFLTGDEQIDGIRTYTVFGENARCWHYQRLAEDQIMEKVMADGVFRIIGEVPVTDCQSGINSLRLPTDRLNLNYWNDFPLMKDDGSDPGNSDDTENKHTHIRLVTSALDLGMPEERKRVRALSIRGIFTRTANEDGITVTLYGSHHRERWHRVASARGAHMRLLRTIAYRWLMVEITAPKSSLLEAVTFELKMKS